MEMRQQFSIRAIDGSGVGVLDQEYFHELSLELEGGGGLRRQVSVPPETATAGRYLPKLTRRLHP